MSAIDDGGSAFPKTGSFHAEASSANDSLDREGMSLRDWFAGQALAFYNSGVSGGAPWPAKQSVAKHAYEMADAMLAARKERAS